MCGPCFRGTRQKPEDFILEIADLFTQVRRKHTFRRVDMQTLAVRRELDIESFEF